MTTITELITRQQAEVADLKARHQEELAAVLPEGDRLLARNHPTGSARTAFDNRRALMRARRLDARNARRPAADPAPETAA